MRGKRGWKSIVSKDIKIHSIGPWGGKQKSSHTLLPGQIAQAVVRPQLDLHRNHIPDISTRSVVARHGVEVGFYASQVNDILATGKTPSTVMMIHHGEIPLRLRRGNRTHRVYFPQLVEPLRVPEIMRLRKSGELVLGKDFQVNDNGLVEIKVHPVVYEPKKQRLGQIHKTNWVSGSKRKQFMENFERKKKSVKTKFGRVVLTETKYVKLPKDVGLFFLKTTDGTSVHIKSLLIDPGFEGPIVLEIFGSKEGKRPDNILAWLVRPRAELR
ncbi:MAG: hypothetical protein AABW59_02085 [archaeon]